MGTGVFHAKWAEKTSGQKKKLTVFLNPLICTGKKQGSNHNLQEIGRDLGVLARPEMTLSD